MRERYCFLCGAPLDWMEYRDANFHLGLSYLKRLWKDPTIQFYCCNCFKQVMTNKNEVKVNLKQERPP